MTHYSTDPLPQWKNAPTTPPYTFIAADMMLPNDNRFAEDEPWPARRWTSEVARHIRIQGHSALST